ncbi:DUF4230 domain-containing protein [Sandaracinobacter neustonicus]|uniref:DUF4230 domain-containing protein n=1 Tax=Sandaracinobacter neustonicus TaxID=1715348 RepID=A0A501XFE7_9SPHN|nr:DUF4230 domain-containing protein [Sandaracinobacter neustonicus]TPE59246.1 DUF4230 domain-containing protein [Sandaracinobacter neustonicus]
MKRLLSIIGALALIGVALGLAAGPERRQQACISIGLCERPDFLGAMLVSVQKQQKLLVLTARLVLPVSSARDTTFGSITVATTRQTAILPATVNYVVDLSALKSSDLNWDRETETLRVQRPPVRPMPASIDWGQAQTFEDSGWQTALTGVSANLKRDNEQKAPGQFAAQAGAKDLLAMADHAADQALETSFRMPLVAAGFTDAKVIVSR